MKRVAFLILTGALLISAPSFGSIDVYEFATESQRQAYLELIRELRCPKCQNQDIADSNAPIAQDMRAAVHRLLQEGRSHDEIVNYMVERFGDFVSYKPKVSPDTYLLWFGPWILLLVGVAIVVMIGRRRALNVDESTAAQLSAEEKSRLEALLKDHQKTSKENDTV